MPLNYLLFDHSEDTEGVHTFEAMASVGPGHWPQVQAEVAQVLAWALRFNERTGSLEAELGAPGQPRHTATLTLTGHDGFAQAFLGAFPSDG